MQPETYTLMHRMYRVASSKSEIEIVLRRFKEIFDATKNSAKRDERFDGAWALSCMAGLYAKLCEPYLAEQAYRESIRSFDKNGMAMNSATVCVALATFFWEQGRIDEAEAALKQNVAYLIRHWGTGHTRVLAAEEELMHFQLTEEIIEASRHHWCKACNVDDYGVGFDFEDTDKAER
ncbi:MAG: hypothetical protein U0103_13730 [Candidatus Obscuribacterales bacterium]